MEYKILSGVMVLLLLSLVSVNALNAGVNSDSKVGVGVDDEVTITVKSESEVNAGAGNNYQAEENANARSVLQISGVEVKTDLEVEMQANAQARVKLSNGKNAEIKVMPATASQRAIAALRLNVCSPDSGCEIQLKETSQSGEVKAVYEVQAKKEYKVFGLFRSHAIVKAQIDTQTGVVIKSERPWWTSLSTEVSGSADSQISA